MGGGACKTGKPYWTGGSFPKSKSVGKFRPEFASELIIWRVINAKLVTLTEVKSGVCDLVDVLKLNAILDHEIAQQHAAMEKPKP